MAADALTFLQALFPEDHAGGYIDLRRINPARGAVEVFIDSGDPAAAAEWAVARRGDGDVYVGVLPRVERAGGRDAVKLGSVVWADCDSAESVLALLSFPLTPSLVVLSGTRGNLHAYWLLEGRMDAEKIEAMNQRIAQALGSDARVYDRARILRVPGTLNHKHEPPVAVELDTASGQRYSVQQLENALPHNEQPRPTATADADDSSPTAWILERLDGVHATGNGWKAHCPAHPDEHPSLSIAEGEDGRCLLHCFAGCSTEAVASALGLTMADLFPSNGPNNAQPLSRSARMVQLALDAGVTLFHDAAHVAFVRVPVGDHQEVWPVRSDRLKRWLRRELHRTEAAIAKAEHLSEAIELLCSWAEFDAPEEEAYLRTAWDADAVLYNLADDHGYVVRADDAGWTVAAQHRIPFLRKDSVLALPVPQRPGDIALLRPYVNVESQDDFILLVAWLVMALRPMGPYPVLVILGAQGSAKSTQTRIHKLLVDPVKAPLRSVPKSLRDLAIAARSSHVLAFDNVSQISPEMSDAFCRLATGDGFATRELYSDDGEVIFEHERPLILNGIDAIVTRQDLLGRAIVLRLAPVKDDQRLDEASLWERFGQDRPRILAALLDGAVSALAEWPSTAPSGFRMADFARWAAAAMPAFGWEPQAFFDAYQDNLSGSLKASLEGSTLAAVITRLMSRPVVPLLSGEPAAIHTLLLKELTEEETKTRTFPKNAQAMSRQLTLLSPALNEVGIEVTTGGQGSGKNKVRWITIRRRADDGTAGTEGTEESGPEQGGGPSQVKREGRR